MLKRGNKRAVSILVGYVLLIVIAFTISGLVYSWLRFYATPPGDEDCPEGVDVIIKDYRCLGDSINITVQNKGLFTIGGYFLRVNDREGSSLGIYTISDGGIELAPGGEYNFEYPIPSEVAGTVRLIDIQPFIMEGGEKRFCKRVSSQGAGCA